MVIFILQQQNWVVGTESVWLAKPKIFSIWPSTEEASGFLVLSVDHREPSDPRGNKQLLHKHSNIKDELAANDGGPTWNRRYHEAPCRRSHCHFWSGRADDTVLKWKHEARGRSWLVRHLQPMLLTRSHYQLGVCTCVYSHVLWNMKEKNHSPWYNLHLMRGKSGF